MKYSTSNYDCDLDGPTYKTIGNVLCAASNRQRDLKFQLSQLTQKKRRLSKLYARATRAQMAADRLAQELFKTVSL